jgi:PTS system mannose-specific IIA component
MVGLVLFSHDKLSEAFLQALEMIAGPQEQLAAVDVKTGMSTAEIERSLDQAIKSVDSGDGVVIITDLFGGSPANFALARMSAGKVEVISGLNLAMVLKMVDLRTRDLSDPAVMARAIAREGKDSIVLASQVLLREKSDQPVDAPEGGSD